MIWPFCILFLKKRSEWIWVRRLFFVCLFLQLGMCVMALLPVRILEHGYYWAVLMIIANVVLTVGGLFAFGKDLESA